MMTQHPSPRTSVIVPARNEAGRIGTCLAALVAQDFAGDYEVIVVDNASSDDTAQRAAAFGVAVVREDRLSAAGARNAGIRAARGEILAFTDADCVPCTSWLRELLAGMSDPDYGCCVGEIAPVETTSRLSRFIHDTGLVCQLRLLSEAPPAASTASVAFRREVFQTIGMFDEEFSPGEDRDFFWRLVRDGRFRYRYNSRAIVLHPHPASLKDFAARAFRHGRGLGRFYRKHADDVPTPCSSRAHAAAYVAKSIGGCALYPLRALRGLASPGIPARQAIEEPFYWKIWALCRLTGILYDHVVGPAFPAPGSDTASGVFPAPVLDLDRAPLLADDDETRDSRVRNDLKKLSRALADMFPGSSVLLTSSLFVGEGRMSRIAAVPDECGIAVVTRRPLDAIPALVRNRLTALPAVPLRERVGIQLVWRPLLPLNPAAVAGAVIAGKPEMARVMLRLRAPDAFTHLLQAYDTFVAAPLDNGRYAEHCARALVQGARALMFRDRAGQPWRDWIGLLSTATIAHKIAEWEEILGTEAVAEVRNAADYLLRGEGSGPVPARHAASAHILGQFAARIRPIPESPTLFRALAALGIRPSRHVAPSVALDAFQAMALCWSPEGFSAAMLREAAGALRVTGPTASGAPSLLYSSLREALASCLPTFPARLTLTGMQPQHMEIMK